MIKLFSKLQQLRKDSRAMAATEFGLIAFPFSVLLLGAFDLGYQNFLRVQMQGVLNDVARTATVQNPDFTATTGTLEERIDSELKNRINLVARGATYTIEQTNYYEFSGVGRSEKLVRDVNGNGQYDMAEDCWEDLDGDGMFDDVAGRDGVGGADDVVFYEVNVEMPRLLPMASLIGLPTNYDITARAAVRNQPYGDQVVPVVECPS
ncbi:pilus assembly protein [Erythrobacter sp.]|nr:pilus assembly protein [Erythrobacter sp.]